MAHLTCVGAAQDEIGGGARAAGRRRHRERAWRCAAIRRPAQTQFERVPGGFGYAADLVAFIRKRFGRGSAWAAPATPRGTSSAATSITDIAHLMAKVDAGARLRDHAAVLRQSRSTSTSSSARGAAGIDRPDRARAHADSHRRRIERMTKLCGASIPPALHAELQRCRDDRGRGRRARHRADHRAGRRAPSRGRARHPLLHAQPVARDARDPDRAQDRPPRLISVQRPANRRAAPRNPRPTPRRAPRGSAQSRPTPRRAQRGSAARSERGPGARAAASRPPSKASRPPSNSAGGRGVDRARRAGRGPGRRTGRRRARPRARGAGATSRARSRLPHRCRQRGRGGRSEIRSAVVVSPKREDSTGAAIT